MNGATRSPAIAKAVSQLPCRSAWLDGELVYLDDDGVSDFDALMPQVRGGGRRLFYQCWDLLHVDGANLTRSLLLDRKAALAQLLGDASPRLRFTSHAVVDGPAFFAQADALGLEGIVSKRASSHYKEGQRTRDWLKVKCWRSYSVVVGGMEQDADGRVALLVGSPGRRRLRYLGRVEMGLHRMNGTAERLARLATSRCPFDGEWGSRRRTWFRPRTEIEIRALPLRPESLLRHAMYVRTKA